MPTVALVEGAMIAFFYNDHEPAHFHASYGDLEMKVRIRDLVVIDG
jgi:hypothetical protein